MKLYNLFSKQFCRSIVNNKKAVSQSNSIEYETAFELLKIRCSYQHQSK